MTATDWRTHDTEANQQRFANAQARLDDLEVQPDGTVTVRGVDGEYTQAMRDEDERFTNWYDANVLSPAHDEHERQGEIEEFQRRWPEPPDGTRIEFEADRGRLYAAYRENDPDHDQIEARWYLYGSDEAWTWRDLVFRYRIPEGLADVAMLVEEQR